MTTTEQLTFDTPVGSWSDRAFDYITNLAAGDEITSDSLRRILGEPRDPNEVGGVITRARRAGLLAYAHGEVPSVRPQARGRWVRRWARTGRSR
jgi:hypothetical protein